MEDAAVVEVLDSLEDLDQVTRHIVLGVTEPLVSRERELILSGKYFFFFKY